MANITYSLEEVRTEASDFLNRKRKRNNTTYLNYRTSINYFIYYLENISKEEELTSGNKVKVLEDFQGALTEGFTYEVEDVRRNIELKPSAVNTHIRRTITFFNSIGLNVEDFNKLKVTKPKYKSLKKEDVELLIAECSNCFKNPEVAVRTSTLITFLFNTAFRIEEALGITTNNIYEVEGSYYVKIHEKGTAKGDLKEVAISKKTYDLVKAYIDLKTVPSDFVFSSVKASNDGKAKRFSRRQFNNNIIKLSKYVDVTYNKQITKTVENNSSHVFRHSKATYLLNDVKEDVVTVQKILRHSSINSTLIYLNPEEEAVNNVRINNDI